MVIPSIVLAETLRGSARDAPVNQVITSVGEVAGADAAVGRLAGAFLGTTRSGATVNAVIVASAVALGGGVLLTGDPGDLRPLADGHPPRLQHVTHAEVVLVRSGREVSLGYLATDRCDLDLIDRLARIQLAARRVGGRIVVRHQSRDLGELLAFVGLGELLGRHGAGAVPTAPGGGPPSTDDLAGAATSEPASPSPNLRGP